MRSQSIYKPWSTYMTLSSTCSTLRLVWNLFVHHETSLRRPLPDSVDNARIVGHGDMCKLFTIIQSYEGMKYLPGQICQTLTSSSSSYPFWSSLAWDQVLFQKMLGWPAWKHLSSGLQHDKLKLKWSRRYMLCSQTQIIGSKYAMPCWCKSFEILKSE